MLFQLMTCWQVFQAMLLEVGFSNGQQLLGSTLVK
jgi:hypothetical protein